MITTLFEAPDLPSVELPPELHKAFDGDLGFESPVLYVNFVASVDGVAAFQDGTPPSAISGSDSDRLVMALLRGFADTVLIGAGTMRTEPEHVWSAEWIYPGLAEPLLRLRQQLGLDTSPRLVVLSASGDLDPSSRALQLGALVVTTDAGASRLGSSLPAACTVRSLGDRADIERVLLLLRAEGATSILSEGGPHLVGELVKADAIDELFLTVTPRLLGRTGADRLGLVEGVSLEPAAFRRLTVAGIKHDAGELFLRYRLRA